MCCVCVRLGLLVCVLVQLFFSEAVCVFVFPESVCGARGDFSEPVFEGCGGFEGVEGGVGFDEDFLYEFFGELWVSCESPHLSCDDGLVSIDNACVCVFASLLALMDVVSVLVRN